MSERMGIGDFARRAGMTISAVRFYGDRGLLPPAWVDPATGYRSYAEDQVGDAALIRGPTPAGHAAGRGRPVPGGRPG